MVLRRGERKRIRFADFINSFLVSKGIDLESKYSSNSFVWNLLIVHVINPTKISNMCPSQRVTRAGLGLESKIINQADVRESDSPYMYNGLSTV